MKRFFSALLCLISICNWGFSQDTFDNDYSLPFPDECAVFINFFGVDSPGLKARKFRDGLDFGYYIDNPCINISVFEFEGETLYAIEPTDANDATCVLDPFSYYVKKSGEVVCGNFNSDGVDYSSCPEGLREAVANGTIITSLPENPAEKLSFEWNTGETTQTINPSEAGEYCVTMTDEITGCSNTSCLYYDPAWFAIDSCVAWINPNEEGNMLRATIEAVAPYTYAWSTGDTTANIPLEEAGEYCVTITDAKDCVSEICEYYDPAWFAIDSCYAWIGMNEEEILAGEEIILTANSEGVAPYTYAWSTGDTTANITIEEAGNFCITITDATGCVSKFCGGFNPFWYQDQHLIDSIGGIGYNEGTEESTPSSANIDLDNKLSISNNLTKEVAPSSLTTIAPNPVLNNMDILLDLSEANKVAFNLFTLDGRSIKNETKNLNAGRQTINWDLSDLPSGAYFLQVQEAGQLTQTLKVIKTQL